MNESAELKKKSLEHIAKFYNYDLDDLIGWLKADMIDMLDEEMCRAMDGPMIFGPYNFEVVRDTETGRWKTKGKEQDGRQATHHPTDSR